MSVSLEGVAKLWLPVRADSQAQAGQLRWFGPQKEAKLQRACRPCPAGSPAPRPPATPAPAAVLHGPGDAAAVAEYQRPKARDAPYTPTTLVGARLPHVAVSVRQPGRLLAGGAASRVASTVDLPAAAGTGLVLLLSESQSAGGWEAAAAAAEAASGVPLLPALIAQSVAPTSGSAAAGEGTAVLQDAGGAWLRLRRLPPEGALLVRPDGHIGWRHAGGLAPQQLAAELERAVRAIMSLPAPGSQP